MKKYLYRAGTLFVGLLLFLPAGCATPPGCHHAQKGPGSDCQTRVCQLAKSSNSWDGARLPAYPEGRPEITVLRIIIPPGQVLPTHQHPVINSGVLIKGELTVVTEGGKTLHLKAGEALVEVVGTWHYGKNEGTVPVEIVVFYAGTEGEPITVHKPNG